MLSMRKPSMGGINVRECTKWFRLHPHPASKGRPHHRRVICDDDSCRWRGRDCTGGMEAVNQTDRSQIRNLIRGGRDMNRYVLGARTFFGAPELGEIWCGTSIAPGRCGW